jgi:hypothetical protein
VGSNPASRANSIRLWAPQDAGDQVDATGKRVRDLPIRMEDML